MNNQTSLSMGADNRIHIAKNNVVALCGVAIFPSAFIESGRVMCDDCQRMAAPKAAAAPGAGTVTEGDKPTLAEPTPEMEANNQREISLNQAVAESLLALQKAKAENAQLRADLDAANGRLELFPEPILESFHYEGGKANLLLSHPVVAHIAADMAAMFDETGGLNYATFEVLHKPTNRSFVFTIQLKTGLTPHQKEVAANARANALAADLQVATAALHNIGIYPPTDGVFCCIDLDEVQVIARQALARLKEG